MNLPQPIPRAEFDRVAALWQADLLAADACQSAWNAIPIEVREADYMASMAIPEVVRVWAIRAEALRSAKLSTEELRQSFAWLKSCDRERWRENVVSDFEDALLAFWRETRKERIALFCSTWNTFKGGEKVNPPVSGWALNVRTQQAFKILSASPTGRKVRALGADGAVVDLKPLTLHSSAVGSGRSSTSGGWLSVPQSLYELVWELYIDRKAFLSANPAIV